MVMPNFLIIGAMKAGTTAVYHYLRQHPQVYMNPKLKEPRFFCYEGKTLQFGGPLSERVYSAIINNIEDYRAYFRGATDEAAIGEASVEYLYIPGTEKRIRAYLPDVKLIAILRHPVDRAYSSYNYLVREGLEKYDEPERIRQNWSPPWHYLQVGFYYPQVKRYFETFDREQVRIYLYDDFRANPGGVVADLFRFLGVDDSFVPNVSIRHNVSGIPHSRTLYNFLHGPHPIKRALKPFFSPDVRFNMQEYVENFNLHPPPPLDPALRRQLVEVYREDILKLQDLLDRDLSRWLQAKEDKPKGNFG
jgi:Sulfotransferase family